MLTALFSRPWRFDWLFGRSTAVADESATGLMPLLLQRRLCDLLLPGTIEEAPAHLVIDDRFCATLAIIGYRRDLPVNWLAPLWQAGIPVRASLHLHQIDTAAAIRAIHERRGELRASDQAAFIDDRIAGKAQQLATQDNEELEEALESGQERLYDLSCYMTVTASTQAELEQRQRAIETVLGQLGLRSIRLRHAQLPGLLATLPLGLDGPRRTHPMTAGAAAAVFPFASGSASGNGVLLGVDPFGGGLVEINPFDRAARSTQGVPNDHIVVLGVSGGGKSLLAKLMILRSLPLRANPRTSGQADCWIIDRDGEYRHLVELAEGRTITLAPGNHGVGLNPLELFSAPTAGSESIPLAPIAERLLRVTGLVGLLIGSEGQLTPRERTIVERSIRAAYATAGIDDQPATHQRVMPTLATVQELLAAGDLEAQDIAFRLEPYTHGAFAGVFGRRSEVATDGRLVVWDIQHLADDPRLEAAGLYLLNDALWTAARRQPRPRLLIVDEAWKLIQHDAGGRMLADLIARGRKYGLAQVVITQHVKSLLENPYGYTICVNAARKILLPQDATSLPLLAELLKLGPGEQQFLATTEPGRALLLAGDERRAVQILPSPAEYEVITTDPAEIAARRTARRRQLAGQS